METDHRNREESQDTVATAKLGSNTLLSNAETYESGTFGQTFTVPLLKVCSYCSGV